MRKITLRVVGLVVAAVVTSSAGCGSEQSSPSAGDVIETNSAPLSDAYPPGTEATALVYLSSERDGALVDTSGLLLVPGGDVPPGGWPVIAWGHGTTGIGDDCAPSVVPGAYYDAVLGEFLERGYAVAATDYIGLGTEGTHPYLIADSAAQATIDMVEASRDAEPGLSSEWVSIGHSQGGQASWAVAEAMTANPDPGYRGAIALAPAPNLSPDLDQLVSSDPLIQQFNLMSLVGLNTQTDIDYGDYLSGRARDALPAVETLCFDDLTRDVTERNLTEADFQFRSDEARTRLHDSLVPHEIGYRPVAQPLLVLQGADDVVVLPEYTREMVDAMPSPENIEYEEFEGADHGTVLTAADSVMAQWLDTAFAS
nr:alpha/beta fold hydrolase [Rhodococcus sp. 15-649-1-2]